MLSINVVTGDEAIRFGGVFSSHGETDTMIEAGDGYELGIDAVNALNDGKGFFVVGKPGTAGFYFKYQFYRRDDDSIEKKHYSELRKLYKEDDVHFIGGSHPKYAEKEMEISNALGRLNYQCCVGPDELYEKGLKYVFGIPASNRKYTKMTIRTLSLQNIGNPAIVYDVSNDFTRTTCEAALQYVDEIGDVQASANEILTFEFNKTAVTDDFYKTVVQETKERGIQAVIACVFPDEGKLLVDSFHDQEYPLKAFFLTTGPTKKEWVESFEPEWRAKDIFSAAQWHRDMKYPDPVFGDTQKYTLEYEKKYDGQHPTYNAAAASAVILTLTEAIKDAFKRCDISKTDGDADELFFNPKAIDCDDDLGERGYDRVLRTLKALDMETFFGRVKFNYYQRNDGLDPVTTQIQTRYEDGNKSYYIEAVMPLGFATKLMNFPASNPYKESCKPGYFVNIEDEFNPCLPCKPGEASHLKNSRHCDSCPIGEWNDKAMQSNCSRCPEGTITEIRGASKLTDCMCKSGFFNVAGQAGVECETCPVGADCPGGTNPPIPQPGYWASSTRREEVYECDPPSNCKGGENVECETGHEGRLCGACSEGYFSAMQVCFRCLNAATIVSLAIGLLIFWYIINVTVSKRVASAEMILEWAQLANIIGDINLNWTKNVNLMFGVINFLDFDVDILEPTCLIKWGFEQNMITQLLLPFVMSTMACLGYLGSCAAYFLLRRRWIRFDGKRYRMLSVFVFVPENSDQLREKWDVTIARFLSSVDVTYVTITKYCLDVFKCESIAGDNVLREDASVVCAGEEYKRLRIIACCGIVLYVIGYLAYTIWKTFDLRNRRAFCDKVNILRYGFIYKKFENDYCFTPVLIIFRKLQFVLVLVFVNNPAFQLGFLAIIIIASLMFQVYAAPYVDTSMDILCSFLLIVLMFGAFAGLMFNSDNMSPEDRRILEWLVIGALMCMVVVFIIILVNEVTILLMGCRVKSRLKTHRRTDPSVGLWNFIRHFSIMHLSQRRLRPSSSGISHASSTFEMQYNYELLETFDTRFVYKSLRRKPELVKQWDELTTKLKDHVSDQSEMSYLSMLPEAKFWRRLVRAFPELVDFFAVAKEEMRCKLRDVLTTLFLDFYVAKKITKLPLMRTINWRDQAPMAFWLAFASPSDRTFFVDLMTQMLQANNLEAGDMLQAMAAHNGFDPLLDERQSQKRQLRRGRSSALLYTYMSRKNDPFQRLVSQRSFHRTQTADSSTAAMNLENFPERSSVSNMPLTPSPSEVSMTRLPRDRTQGESSCSESPDVSVNQGSEHPRERSLHNQTSSGSQNNGKSVGFSDNV